MAGARHHSGPDATPDGSAHLDADRGAVHSDTEADMDADFNALAKRLSDAYAAEHSEPDHRCDESCPYLFALLGPLPDPVQLQPAAGRMPDGALGAGVGDRGDGTGRDGLR